MLRLKQLWLMQSKHKVISLNSKMIFWSATNVSIDARKMLNWGSTSTQNMKNYCTKYIWGSITSVIYRSMDRKTIILLWKTQLKPKQIGRLSRTYVKVWRNVIIGVTNVHMFCSLKTLMEGIAKQNSLQALPNTRSKTTNLRKRTGRTKLTALHGVCCDNLYYLYQA